jgi:siroheme synthase
MARETAQLLAGRLLDRGLSPTTPVAIVRSVSQPEEEAQATSLGAVACGAAPFPDSGPTLVLVGAALGVPGGPAAQGEAGRKPGVPAASVGADSPARTAARVLEIAER